MSQPPSSTEYEQLVAELVQRLPLYSQVTKTRVEHNVVVQGKATKNQIDVVWDFTDSGGQDQRVVFEARSYAGPIQQGALHAFRSVVDDIQDPARPVTGVMVTTIGYQAGAKRIADTYELLILELRVPTPKDLANRLTSIHLEFRAQLPRIADLRLESVEVLGSDMMSDGNVAMLGELTIDIGGSERRLADVLFRGELGSLEAPNPPHPVRREFDPPATVRLAGEPIARVRAVSALVGVEAAPPTVTVIRSLEDVAWMLRNSLDGSVLWFGGSGKVWSTDA